MLTYNANIIGRINVKTNGKKVTYEIRQGNALAVVIQHYKDRETKKDMVALITFYADEQHLKNMMKNENNIFPTYGDEEVLSIELNLFFKEANTLLKYFVRSDYKVECTYEETEKETSWSWQR